MAMAKIPGRMSPWRKRQASRARRLDEVAARSVGMERAMMEVTNDALSAEPLAEGSQDGRGDGDAEGGGAHGEASDRF